MMKQYHAIKESHKDAILFFRLGDFYEMFRDDAEEVSRILSITLTQRHGIPMCGIPYHAAPGYLSRLLKAGKKIAICEQVSLPEKGKGIARREVVEIITPGTVVTDDYLDQLTNNYLMAFAFRGKKELSLAYADISTGEFRATCYDEPPLEEKVLKEMGRLHPREILCQESLSGEAPRLYQYLKESSVTVNFLPDWYFDQDNSLRILRNHFGTTNLKAFGLEDDSIEVLSAGVLLEYLGETAQTLLPHLRTLDVYADSQYLSLDESTQRNLEILHSLNQQGGGSQYTLQEVLDHTKTPMGSRLLKNWLLHPLKDKTTIENRLAAVGYLHTRQILLGELREHLGHIRDLERLSSRLAMDKAHAKDLLAIAQSVEEFCVVKVSLEKSLEKTDSPSQAEVLEWLTGVHNEESYKVLRQTGELIENTLCDDPSLLLSEGRLIRRGVNAELDQLKDMRHKAKDILEAYRQEVMEAAGLPRLKLKQNKIIGYYFEVTKVNTSLVPEDFIRRQSLVNAERYTTEQLSQMESQINNAWEGAVEKEKQLFLELRSRVKEGLEILQETSRRLALWDVIQSFAHSATLNGYTCPQLVEENSLHIKEGRHPVVENHLPPGSFVPNDLDLSEKKAYFALITGPNMAGKSTYLRQNALILLMAHCGSYVPAMKAVIGLTDRIFCRVGASDNLARGESTFLVEMNETAHILRRATPRSLIIMDEVGRGTSTTDGLSIARAVSEYLLEETAARTLFATHYHELTHLEHPSLINLSLAVKEDRDNIIFLKHVVAQAANRSYGIHVARLAGLPDPVIRRAREILEALEPEDCGPGLPPSLDSPDFTSSPRQQLLFDDRQTLWEELQAMEPMEITPLQALEILIRWKKIVSP